MSTNRQWLASLLALSALTACASAPPAGSAASPQDSYVAGSRAAVAVDPRTGPALTAAPLQSVSADELRSTGRTDVAAALRMLVPAIH